MFYFKTKCCHTEGDEILIKESNVIDNGYNIEVYEASCISSVILSEEDMILLRDELLDAYPLDD